MSYPVPVMEIGGANRSGSPWEMLAAMNCGGGMNGMNAWWPLLFLLFGWGGFGYGGFGGFGGGFNRGGNCCNSGLGAFADLAVTDATNIAEIKAGLNYTAQTQVGQNTLIGQVKDNMFTGFANLTNAVTNSAYQNQLGQRDLQANIADCCCKTQTAIAASTNAVAQQISQLNYNQAMQTCELKQAIAAEGAATRQLLLDQETERLRTALAKAQQEVFILKNCNCKCNDDNGC